MVTVFVMHPTYAQVWHKALLMWVFGANTAGGSKNALDPVIIFLKRDALGVRR